MSDAPAGAPPSMTRAAAGMGAAAAVSRAFGGLRMVVIAAVLGTTALGNTFQASNSVSNVLFELLAAGALSAVLVPTFVELLDRGEQPRAEEVAGGVLSVALVVLGAVALVGMLAAEPLARLLTAGVDDPTVAAAQQDLATFLLRFFIPQVLLYALGAVATAVLHAQGRFAITALAPIGNTVVVVLAMIGFRLAAGPDPGLDLSTTERLWLAAGGTLGVAAFVAVPALGLRASGFRFRLGLRRGIADPSVRGLLKHSSWATLQHSGAGILLAAALVVGGAVTGGVVAFQLAMVVFLAPYGILAQPIHTAVLPRLSVSAAAGDRDGLHGALLWAADAMAFVTLPIAALLFVLARPIMDVLAFGAAARGDGPELLAAALAGLAIGLPAYGLFLLLTRAGYAIGDSRTPGLAAVGSALVGAALMVVTASWVHGSARLVALGLAHSAAFAIGALCLAWRLHPAVGGVFRLAQVRPLLAAVLVGAGAWTAMEAWAPDGRWRTALAVVAVSAAFGGLYLIALRSVGAWPPRDPVAPGRPA